MSYFPDIYLIPKERLAFLRDMLKHCDIAKNDTIVFVASSSQYAVGENSFIKVLKFHLLTPNKAPRSTSDWALKNAPLHAQVEGAEMWLPPDSANRWALPQ